MQDPLLTLREYRQLAPWSLRDLAALTGAILDASGIRPINAAAAVHPNERTVRFYVTRGLVAAPEGRGTAATYNYRHLLQVLGIKLRQMEGATLAAIAGEMAQQTGDVLERRVAAALGSALPAPGQLPLSPNNAPSGRSGRALRQLHAASPPTSPALSTEPVEPQTTSTWHRLVVEPGIALEIHDAHPLARRTDRYAVIAGAVRAALEGLAST